MGYTAAMAPRHVLGSVLLSASVAIHFCIQYGLLVAAVAAFVLPAAQRPEGGYSVRARAKVEAVWGRLRGRPHTATLSTAQRFWLVAMVAAVAGLGAGLGIAVGVGWGIAAAALAVAALSLRADAAE